MSEIDTGGPAFPTATLAQKTEGGMTLRDYFAAKAMDVGMNKVQNFYGIEPEHLAKWCFEMADAMLKTREQS